MTGAKGRTRQERRLVDMQTSAPTSPAFLDQFPPDELDQYRIDFDLGPGSRCIQKMTFYHGRIVWFAIMHQRYHLETWRDVARADTCHDEAHLHLFRQAGDADEQYERQTICSLNSIDDVEVGFDHASELVTASWEANEGRWHE